MNKAKALYESTWKPLKDREKRLVVLLAILLAAILFSLGSQVVRNIMDPAPTQIIAPGYGDYLQPEEF